MTVRGTTPTHVFTIPWTEEELEIVLISYVQNGEIRLIKTQDDLEFDDNHRQALLHLSERDTLTLVCDRKKGKEGLVDIQWRVQLTTGEIFASKPIAERVMPLHIDLSLMDYATLHGRTLSSMANLNTTHFKPDFGWEVNNSEFDTDIINQPVTADVDTYIFDGGKFDETPDRYDNKDEDGDGEDDVIIYDGGGV